LAACEQEHQKREKFDKRMAMQAFDSHEVIPGNRDRGMVLLGDHAMNRLPTAYGTLGLDPAAFARHIAYDIGIEALTRELAARLGVPAVISCFSRLLIDPNRGEDDPTLIMKISDGAIIPGNHPITPEEWQHRLDTYHRPYHQAVDRELQAVAEASGQAPLVLSLHSYTPAWKGVARPWHAAVLWDSDDRAVLPLLDHLRRPGDIIVGDNEPYDGALKNDSMYRHCMMTGLPHALLEVRQDLIGDVDGVTAWADRLAPIFQALNLDPALHEYRIFPSRTGPYPKPA
jgi:predicted N-formylglutamate amidohydrolase